MCLGSSTNFSRYIASLPKAALDSVRALFHASAKSSSFHIRRIPLPPPPAVAFSMTGYPISLATLRPSFSSLSNPSDPGTHGTPAAIIVALALDLSPIPLIISGLAPINLIPWSRHISENFAFSDKKP